MIPFKYNVQYIQVQIVDLWFGGIRGKGEGRVITNSFGFLQDG
jgi:hypothetical protein